LEFEQTLYTKESPVTLHHTNNGNFFDVIVKAGQAEGEALVSPEPISFFGGVDPETGVVVEAGHPLEGECVAGRVLVFPTGKGSTVGSYILYRMKKGGVAPAAIINTESEPIVAVGAIISDIPMLDGIDINEISTGDWVQIHDGLASVRSDRDIHKTLIGTR
jgi:predicted aconitase with swiveling domain